MLVLNGEIQDINATTKGTLAAIKTVTDAIPDAGALTAIAANALHADTEATEIEHHLHGNEIWFGDAATPDAGVHEADRESLVSFRVDAGTNTWGTAVLVLGTTDTPVATGMTKFDLHKVLVTATERNVLTYLRFTFGTSEAQGITDGNSTVVALITAATVKYSAVEFMQKRATAGTKMWVNAKVVGDTGTVDFIFGLHEYLV